MSGERQNLSRYYKEVSFAEAANGGTVTFSKEKEGKKKGGKCPPTVAKIIYRTSVVYCIENVPLDAPLSTSSSIKPSDGHPKVLTPPRVVT